MSLQTVITPSQTAVPMRPHRRGASAPLRRTPQTYAVYCISAVATYATA
ncbi:MAG: hypothetical protein MI749_14925 [Desulfovibrionales bacterium]|nr:hypothetical protein [Desulfovibrionales bacterium]